MRESPESERVLTRLQTDGTSLQSLTHLSAILKDNVTNQMSSWTEEVQLVRLILSIRSTLEISNSSQRLTKDMSQKHFGLDSDVPRPFLLPTLEQFLDFSPESGLRYGLEALLSAAETYSIDLTMIEELEMSRLLLLLRPFIRALQAHCKSSPSFFIGHVPLTHRKSVTAAILKCGGFISTSELKATHVLGWREDVDTKENNLYTQVDGRAGARMVSPLPSSPAYARIHWLGCPNSYDEILPVTSEIVRASAARAIVIANSTIANSIPSSITRAPVTPEVMELSADIVSKCATAVASANGKSSLTPGAASLLELYGGNMLSGLLPKTRWYVSCQFVWSALRWNEWGNPQDFELSEEDVVGEDTSVEANSPKPSLKRGSSKSGGPSLKRQATQFSVSAPPPPLTLLASEKLCTEVAPLSLQSNTMDKTFRVLELSAHNSTVVTSNTRTPITPPTIPTTAQVIPNDGSNCVGSLTDGLDIQSNRGEGVLRLLDTQPCHAVFDLSWFCFDSVHAMERKVLSSLLMISTQEAESRLAATGVVEANMKADSTLSKEAMRISEKEYKELRNSIVNMYLSNPLHYLTATETRRLIPSEASAISAIHMFLDAVGLINSSIPADRRLPTSRFQGLSAERVALLDALREWPSSDASRRKYLPCFIDAEMIDRTSVKGADSIEWTLSLDDRLRALVSKYQTDWARVANDMSVPGLTPLAAMQRFATMPIVPLIPGEESPFGTSSGAYCITPDLFPPLTAPDMQSLAASPLDGVTPARLCPLTPDIIPNNGEPVKQKVLMNARAMVERLEHLEKLLHHLSTEVGTAVSSHKELLSTTFGVDSESVSDLCNLTELETIPRKLREELQLECRRAALLLSTRNEVLLKDYFSTRGEILNSKLRVLSHVDKILTHDAVSLDQNLRELTVQKLYLGLSPLLLPMHEFTSETNIQ